MRFLPNAFIFALILTFVSIACALGLTSFNLFEIISFWGDGFFDLLSFSMQMALVLICGNVLADTAIVDGLLRKVAKLCTSQVKAVLLITIISIITCYINWGLGLVISAVFTIYVSKRLKRQNFALLVASAYSGFLVWHGGLSGSIPLKAVSLGITLDSTLFSSFNLIILTATAVCLVVINTLFAKFSKLTTQAYFDTTNKNLIQRSPAPLESSLGLKLVVATLGLSFLVLFIISDKNVDLNFMIMLFLFLGILLHKNLALFSSSFDKNVRSASGIILQFMFYAGIMGIITKSGLGVKLSNFFVDISTTKTFLINTYISAGILNFFVPSGGGQWAIQGPLMLPAAKAIGVSSAKAAMAIAWGDAWTNMIQPFWAIPILKLTGLEVKDIMLYLFTIFIVVGAVTLTIIGLLANIS